MPSRLSIEEILKLLANEPDAEKRLRIRIASLPLGYLATWEAKRDIEIVLDRFPRA